MNAQELLKSPNMIGLTMPGTKRVAAMEILSLPKAIRRPPVKLPAPPTARTQQVARPVHWPISPPDIWEGVGFALLAFAALLLIFLVSL